MLQTRRSLLAVPLLLAGTLAHASEIRDRAGMFDGEAVRNAGKVLDQVEARYKVPTVIETVPSLNGRTIDQASEAGAKASGIQGVYVLISKGDNKLEARAFRDFLGRGGRRSIEQAIIGEFKRGDFDAGLVAGAEAVRDAVAEVGGMPKAGAAPVAPARAPVARRGGGGGGLGTLVVIGGVILAVLIGIRLFGGNRGYAGPGGMGRPGYGGAGGGYGRGGGGFMSGMFGGLGGALAGNWLYDQFGRHHGSGGYTSDAGPGDAGAPPAGGDWGGGDGGADWGGGGGGADWGGGGGGDWGGGGGGGGDWGGGGGGDGGGTW